jgi:hypothetical protein
VVTASPDPLKAGDLLPFRVLLFYNQPRGDFKRYVSPRRCQLIGADLIWRQLGEERGLAVVCIAIGRSAGVHATSRSHAAAAEEVDNATAMQAAEVWMGRGPDAHPS